MMRMGTFVSGLSLALALFTPADGHTQAVADPASAELLEAEAARIQDQRSRWADAVSLYRSAAALRQQEDPQARQDLFLAANLAYQLGDLATAVDALESAGTRAVAAGDALFATQMFANAAQIAEEAGMTDQERRLRTRVADLASAADAQRRGRS
jgi:hypothetical protein